MCAAETWNRESNHVRAANVGSGIRIEHRLTQRAGSAVERVGDQERNRNDVVGRVCFEAIPEHRSEVVAGQASRIAAKGMQHRVLCPGLQ